MSNIKFCRFTSNCGPQSKCKGNLFGLTRGKCVSTKGSCRLDSACPKYYQCVGNQSGLTEGKCLLAISKSNPLSKSLGNVSTSLLDPASQYRRTHTVNWMMIIIIFAILFGVGYFVYDAFLKPSVSSPGSCLNSADCAVKGPGGKNILFQCGIKEYSSASPPQLLGVKGNKCDCSVFQGGGYSSTDTMYRDNVGAENPNWLFDTGDDGKRRSEGIGGARLLESATNCKMYINYEGRLVKPKLNKPVSVP